MWDFSWLERRWPGAGYENWDTVLDELADRGYDAVRIDAYPHLVDADPYRVWKLLPQWDVQVWGAQSVVNVQVLPALIDFIRAANGRGIRVALSSWFRQDVGNTRMSITSPSRLAEVWAAVLGHLDAAGVMDGILYVDLCNEFPQPVWAPFLYGTTEGGGHRRTHPEVSRWMRESTDILRAQYPNLPLTFSIIGQWDSVAEEDVSMLDLLEPHVWMAIPPTTDFYDKVGYGFERFSSRGYDNLVARGKQIYRRHQAEYDQALLQEIDHLAEWSRATGLPLVTTECWSIVDYKDWPGLDWDWVLDLNERAVDAAVATGRWLGVATSNFCGPQFHGVWREVEYHRRLTRLIRESAISPELAQQTKGGTQ